MNDQEVPTPMDERSEVRANFFDPDDHVLGVALHAVNRRQPVRLSDGQQNSVVLFPEHGEYFARIVDIQGFCRTAPSQIRRESVSAGERDRLLGRALEPRNLEEFMWIAAYSVAHGRLMRGCGPIDVVSLRHWPNLAFLPHDLNTIRLCALFSRSPTSLSVASRLLDVPSADVWQFYSAARAAGLVEIVNRRGEQPAMGRRSEANRSLIERVLRRIAIA